MPDPTRTNPIKVKPIEYILRYITQHNEVFIYEINKAGDMLLEHGDDMVSVNMMDIFRPAKPQNVDVVELFKKCASDWRIDIYSLDFSGTYYSALGGRREPAIKNS